MELTREMEKMPGNEVRILKTETVKPSGVVAHEGPIHLPKWDQIFRADLYTKIVHFYSKPTAEWMEMRDTLKGSLGRALAQFSPLAGRFRLASDGRRVEIYCNGQGAEVLEAECCGNMSWFREGSDSERVNRLLDVAEHKMPVEEVPLLVVQLTKFRCGGVSVGVGVSHAAIDGLGLSHFLAEWSRLARGEPMKEAPILDRTILRSKERELELSDHIEFIPPLFLGEQGIVKERKEETVKLALSLTKSQIDGLKNVATNACVRGDNSGVSRRFSRYEVVSSHIWRCLCKARRHEGEQPTTMSIVINARSRSGNDKLPKRYFGNTIFMTRTVSRVGEIISSPLGLTCGKLRDAIKKFDEDYIRSDMDMFKNEEDLSIYGQEGKPYHGNPNLRVISWLTLPIYETNFGWGNVTEVFPITYKRDGSTILVPGPENDGSIRVFLSLQVAYVDEFKKHFYGNINTMSPNIASRF